MADLFNDYLTYAGKSEVPDVYHRWTYLSIIASLLGRRVSFKFGHSNIYPNLYTLLMGAPAARKSAAIGVGTKLLRQAGYKFLAPERMSREAFLQEMVKVNEPDLMDAGSLDALIDNLDDLDGGTTEFTVHASEFIDFMGQGDKDYLMLLTTLYDCLPSYRNPKIVSKSVTIHEPTINLLGAATPENLNMAFPANMMDTGTLSRFLFIFSNPTKEKVLIPSGCLDPEAEYRLVETLKKIREMRGVMTLTDDGEALLGGIYEIAEPLKDPRLSYYSGRRLGHLIKLCIIQAASRLSLTITAEDILTANTILCAAESRMSNALGHFGSGRYSQAIHNIIQYIEARPSQLSTADVYKVFSTEFSRQAEFTQILGDLIDAGRLKFFKKETKAGPKTVIDVVRANIPSWATDLMVPNVLTDAEREAIGL